MVKSSIIGFLLRFDTHRDQTHTCVVELGAPHTLGICTLKDGSKEPYLEGFSCHQKKKKKEKKEDMVLKFLGGSVPKRFKR